MDALIQFVDTIGPLSLSSIAKITGRLYLRRSCATRA